MSVSAPAEKQALLLDLAACDLALSRAKGQLSNLADTLGILQREGDVNQAKSARHEIFLEIESIKAELARSESDVEVVHKRIATDTERLAHTSSAKDAQGLEHELESLHKRLADLEDIELAIMERLEEAEKRLSEADAALRAAEESLRLAHEEEARTSSELREEIGMQQAARDTLVAQLPEDLYALYERQRERYGVGATLLRGGTSSASGVALTEADLQKIRSAADDEVLLCPDSNAILVRTKESGL